MVSTHSTPHLNLLSAFRTLSTQGKKKHNSWPDTHVIMHISYNSVKLYVKPCLIESCSLVNLLTRAECSYIRQLHLDWEWSSSLNGSWDVRFFGAGAYHHAIRVKLQGFSVEIHLGEIQLRQKKTQKRILDALALEALDSFVFVWCLDLFLVCSPSMFLPI